MPPPTPTCMSPARIGLVEDDRRAQPGRADLVDRLRGDLLGDAGLDLRLARGNLPLAGLQHLTHDDVLDLLGLDAGALERGADGQRRRARSRRAWTGRRPSCRWGCARRRGSRSWAWKRLSPVGRCERTESENGSGPLAHSPRLRRAQPTRLDMRARREIAQADARPCIQPGRRHERRRHGRGGRIRGRGARRQAPAQLARAARLGRGAHILQGARADARRRQALAAGGPRRARRLHARARARGGRGGARAGARAIHAHAVLGAAAGGDDGGRCGAGGGHDPQRLPLRAPQVARPRSGDGAATPPSTRAADRVGACGSARRRSPRRRWWPRRSTARATCRTAPATTSRRRRWPTTPRRSATRSRA